MKPWNERVDGVHERRARIAELEQEIRDAKAAFEATVAERKAEMDMLKAADERDIQDLTVDALANEAAGAGATFGGVQLRRTEKLLITDEELALTSLDGIEIDNKPLVKRSLDQKLVLAFAKMRKRQGLSIDGVQLYEDVTLAILKRTEDSPNPVSEA